MCRCCCDEGLQIGTPLSYRALRWITFYGRHAGQRIDHVCELWMLDGEGNEETDR